MIRLGKLKKRDKKITRKIQILIQKVIELIKALKRRKAVAGAKK
jgi:hypothetical protein